MRYNGLNNMFFPLCLINDNHSVTSPSHTKKTKSDNYSKHHKNTLIDNWICPYISRHLLSLNPLQARCRRYSRG
ncbi:hypothetical protein OSK02_18520, partial [Escherichia coli]|nr:hypothetical protein [Escherichia coli]MDA6145269.1 hypothetical protein [Escherichia coli]